MSWQLDSKGALIPGRVKQMLKRVDGEKEGSTFLRQLGLPECDRSILQKTPGVGAPPPVTSS